jgi:hypothetical protein
MSRQTRSARKDRGPGFILKKYSMQECELSPRAVSMRRHGFSAFGALHEKDQRQRQQEDDRE